MHRAAAAFAKHYGTPDLGNLPDPLDEAIYILLTYQTDLARAQQVWRNLKSLFPSWEQALVAPPAALRTALRPAGLQRARERLIRGVLFAVLDRWGSLSLDDLRRASTPEAEHALRELPGFDIKGARCVLMYSLGRRVFPVDSNAWRFMQRFGVLAPQARYRRRASHDDLQELVAPKDRHNLHVNLVAHGQRTCLPRAPHCAVCPVRRACATWRSSQPVGGIQGCDKL